MTVNRQTNSPNILVIGSFMMDLVVRGPRLPYDGETIIGSSFQRFPGGKGANQAVAAARLGANVAMAGKLGEDGFGREMLETLRAENVDTKNILIDKKMPTGVGSVTVDDSGNNRIVVVPGANMYYQPEDVRVIRQLIKDSDILMMQLEIDIEVVKEALVIASGYNVPVLLNPAPAQKLSEEMLKHIAYLTPNETEAELLTGIKVTDIESAGKAADKLVRQGIKNVIITLGEQGALIADESGWEHIAAFQVTPIDSVAAGDAFNAAFAIAIVEGKPCAQAAKFANAAGALAVLTEGAIPSLPARESVDRFLADIDVSQDV